jgi:DNA-binding response OmpR family regulator
MAKPFALAELSARLRALLRRGAPRESVLRVVSYGVLGRLLDADVTMRPMELTDGLRCRRCGSRRTTARS